MTCPICESVFIPKPWPNTRQKFCSLKCSKRDWYNRHPEEIKEKNRRYAQNYRDRLLATKRAWNRSPSGRAKKKLWYQKNRAKRVRLFLDRYRSDPTTRAVQSSRMKSRKILKGSGVPMRCKVCGSGGKLHCHHINFNALDRNLSNLMWVCIDCHGDIHSECGRGK